MCTGAVICNDIFDCIDKKSLVKESSYIYDYIPETTQKFSKIREMNISEAYELGDDGFCPQYCSQCDINKICKKWKEGYNYFNDSKNEDKESKILLWVVISIVGVLLIIGIVIAIYLLHRKKKVENVSNEIKIVPMKK